MMCLKKSIASYYENTICTQFQYKNIDNKLHCNCKQYIILYTFIIIRVRKNNYEVNEIEYIIMIRIPT